MTTSVQQPNPYGHDANGHEQYESDTGLSCPDPDCRAAELLDDDLTDKPA